MNDGEFGLSKRAVLEGFSRGGLYAVNFAAAHPDMTAALYLVMSVPLGYLSRYLEQRWGGAR